APHPVCSARAGRVGEAAGGPAEGLVGRRESLAAGGMSVVDAPVRLARGRVARVADARARHAVQEEGAPPPAGEPTRLGRTLDEDEGKSLLESFGVRSGARRVAATRAEAHRALTELGTPVVVKVLDATVLHKSDVGGVRVGVRSAEDLDAALHAIDAIAGGPR